MKGMKTEELLTHFLKNTFTKKDISKRLRLLREYFEAGYFTFNESDVTKFLLTKHATTDDINAFISWGDDFYASFTKDTMYDIVNTLTGMVKELPCVVVYIPYEAVPAEVIRLGTWCRSNINEAVVVDLKTDTTLLGGCAFVWKGMYRDYSLRYYMRKRREQITKIINEYVGKYYQLQ